MPEIKYYVFYYGEWDDDFKTLHEANEYIKRQLKGGADHRYMIIKGEMIKIDEKEKVGDE